MAWGILHPVKERLTGAIILVALIVLLVPELLTGPIRMKSAPAVSVAAASPQVAEAAPAEPPLRSYTLTLGGAPPAQQATVTPAVTAPVQLPESSAQRGPAQRSAGNPAGSASESAGGNRTAGAPGGPGRSGEAPGGGSGLQAAKSPAHSALREARSPASSTGWVVQLGSFASRRNADRLARTLAGRGFRMSVSPARAGSRVLWRVRAGPAHDRSAAQRLAARLRVLGHRGELLPVT
jgi:DedD protein